MTTLAIARPVALGLAALVGMAAGLGGYTFYYGRGWSYLTNDPAACANCHVMNPQHSAWLRGSHRLAATCNDCHTPSNALGKYYVKARNGFWHSFYFTSGRFPEPIRITPGNREVALGRCRECHAGVVHAMAAGRAGDAAVDCLHCHRSVGHRD